MKPREVVRPLIRWTIKKDMPSIGLIDEASFECPWPTGVYLDMLREKNVISITAEIDGKVIGYMIFRLCRGHFRVLRMAVHPTYRGLGIGTDMVDHLRAKVGNKGREAVVVEVSEYNLPAQLFFRDCGFVCEHINPGDGADTYEMVYHVPA